MLPPAARVRGIVVLNNQGLASVGGGVSILRHLTSAFACRGPVTIVSFDAPAPGWDGVVQRRIPPPPPPGRAWRLAPLLRARHLTRVVPQAWLLEAGLVISLDCHFAGVVRRVPRERVVHLSLSSIPDQERAAGAGSIIVNQYRWLQRRMNQRAAFTVVASRMHRDALQSPNPTHILYPMLPGDGVPRGPANALPVVLSAGRLEPGKGFDQVLALAALLRDVPARFVIVGDGPARAMLEAVASPNVHFIGVAATIDPVLAQADIVLNLSPYESFGMIVFEAMRAGVTPVGRSDAVVGYAEIVRDGVDCCLLDLRDPAAAASRLCLLLTDPAARQRLGAAAQAAAGGWLAGPTYAERFLALCAGALEPRS